MKSAPEVYIEVAVYTLFVVFGVDLLLSENSSQTILGAVMIGVSVVKILWLNRKWNRQRDKQ